MFSFGQSNSYPLSYYNNSPSFTIQENNNTSIQQNHHHHFQGSYNSMSSLINPSLSENPINNNVLPPNPTSKFILEAPIDQENNILSIPSSHMVKNSFSSKREIVKKDRHTKILTAQGVRDRRVRLSISIARDFFNLQDMLGFDKASKTLGWLLAKSKGSIDELKITLKNNKGSSIDENFVEEDNDEKEVLSGKISSRKKRGRKDQKSAKGKIDVKEVRRAKARERARERTKNKKMMFSSSLSLLSNHQHHQRSQKNLMACQPSVINPSISVGESVVIKSKSKGLCHNHDHSDMGFKHYDQEGCNYNYNDYLTKFAFESNGGFPALNVINLSTEIHINAKPWETSSSQILH